MKVVQRTWMPEVATDDVRCVGYSDGGVRVLGYTMPSTLEEGGLAANRQWHQSRGMKVCGVRRRWRG